MTYAINKASISRKPILVASISIPTCSNTFGSAPCTASGTCCYYTYPTCKDVAHFTSSATTYLYSTHTANPPSTACIPLLKSVGDWVTEIKPDEFLTRVTNLNIDLFDIDPLPLANPSKTVTNTETDGSYWRNFIQRNPHYIGKEIDIYQGFEGDSYPSDYTLVFKGVITNIVINTNREVQIKVKDYLYKITGKVPPAQGSNITIANATGYGAGGTIIQITDCSQMLGIEEAVHNPNGTYYVNNLNPPRYVLIENEILSYTGIDSFYFNPPRLTGVVGGLFGTTPAAHIKGTQVKNIVAVGDSSSATAGVYGDTCFLTILLHWGNIPFSYLAQMGLGMTVAVQFGPADSELVLNDVTGLPNHGYLILNNQQIIQYTGLDVPSKTVTVVEHGCFDTPSSTQIIGRSVDLFEISYVMGDWLPNSYFKRIITAEKEITAIMKEFRESCGLSVWQGGDTYIHCKLAPVPLTAIDTITHITDETELVEDSIDIDNNIVNIITREAVHYAPIAGEYDPGTDITKYSGHIVHFDPNLEGVNYYNEVYDENLYLPWITDEDTAAGIAARRLLRYRYGSPIISFDLEMKDSQIEVGDFISITTKYVTLSTGVIEYRGLYEVTYKKYTPMVGVYSYKASKCGSSISAGRAVVISELTDDYDDVTADEQADYGFVSSGTTSGVPGGVGDITTHYFII